MRGTILFSILIFGHILSGQILCIKCYDQNDSISSGVNNLVLNGGFELTTCSDAFECFCPNSSIYSCDINNWKCGGGGSGTEASLYDSSFTFIPQGKRAAYFGNGLSTTCTNKPNDTSCLKQIGCTVSNIPDGFPKSGIYNGSSSGVSLEQTVSGLTKEAIYVLEFWVGGDFFGEPLSEPGLFAVDLGFGNSFLRCNLTVPQFGIGTRYLIQFKALSTSHTIKFTNWGHMHYSCAELIIDDVRLYTLAELSHSVAPCITASNNINEDISISLYPNPFSNELLVKSNDFEQKKVILFDITSRKLIQQSFTNSVSLNTEYLSP